MPSVKRRLFNLLAAVSLVLCVMTAALWARSYWGAEGICTRFSGAYVEKGRVFLFQQSWARGAGGVRLMHRPASSGSYFASGPQTTRNVRLLGIQSFATSGPAPFFVSS